MDVVTLLRGKPLVALRVKGQGCHEGEVIRLYTRHHFHEYKCALSLRRL